MSGKNCYSLKLFIGDKDFTYKLNNVRIEIGKDFIFQKIVLNVSVNRIEYTSSIMPFKDKVKLDIVSARGLESDNDVPDIDASFSYDLTIVEEQGNTTTNNIQQDIPTTDIMVFTCIQRDQYKSLQTMCKDLSFFNVTRKEIIDKILEGCQYELQSDLVNPGQNISQLFIEPCRRYQAIQYVHNRIDLFVGAPPDYINYCIDGKIYLGSCIDNNLKPLSIIIGSESNDIDKISSTNANNSEQYDYVAIQPIVQSNNYNTTCMRLGNKQRYCYLPMNHVYVKNDKSLKDYNNNLCLSNTYGDNVETGNHVKNTNVKESWVTYNGLDFIDNVEDNEYLAEHHIFENINQAISLNLNLQGTIKFEHFLMVGRKCKITSGYSAERYNGDYFLDTAILSFKMNGDVWIPTVSVKLKTSIKVGNC